MNKLVLVTGGSRGLGAALCAQYAAEGWQVVEFSRNGGLPGSHSVDFSAPQAAAEVFETVLQSLATRSYQEIVAIGNAATIAPMGPAGSIDVDGLLANVQVNSTTGMLFIARVLAAFQTHACRKTIVNVSSGAALRPLPGWSLYCAAKAGMEHFVRCVATEQAQQRHPFILANIGPGVIDTDMQTQIRAMDSHVLPMVEQFRALKTSGALRPPEEVAAFIRRVIARGLPNGGRVDIDLDGGAP